jgi:hypothetical protein
MNKIRNITKSFKLFTHVFLQPYYGSWNTNLKKYIFVVFFGRFCFVMVYAKTIIHLIVNTAAVHDYLGWN